MPGQDLLQLQDPLRCQVVLGHGQSGGRSGGKAAESQQWQGWSGGRGGRRAQDRNGCRAGAAAGACSIAGSILGRAGAVAGGATEVWKSICAKPELGFFYIDTWSGFAQ